MEQIGEAADLAFNTASESASQTAHSVESLSNSAGTASDSLNDVVQTTNELSQSIEDFGDTSETSGEQAGEFGEEASNAMNTLGEALVSAGIVVVLQKIGEKFMECSEKAAEFEVATAKIATVADTTCISMESVSDSVFNLSKETGESVNKLSDATYQAISASVETENSVAFAGKATKLATGGFTDASMAVDVLTTAINAYGLETEDASKISDMLITTQNLGKTTVDELAASVGKVIPLASAYNVEMDNLSAAYALLTANGVATAESGTYLKAMLGELGDSASGVSAVLEDQVGASFANLMSQGYSLGDVLGILGHAVNGDATAFNELWSSSEAGVGALSLLNSGSDKFNEVLGEMQDSAGATSAAYETMTGTTEYANQRMSNAMENLKISVGEKLNPVIKDFYNTGADILDFLSEFIEENPEVVAGVVAIATAIGVFAVAIAAAKVATLAASAATAVWSAVLALNPVTLIATGVIALVGAITAFISILGDSETEYDTWTASTKEQYDELQNLNDEYEKACETFGETSEEALRLKYQVDDLSEAFESSKQTVEEYIAECDAIVENNNRLIQSYQESLIEINQNEIGTLTLIQKLEDLATQNDKTVASEEQMKAIIDQLNKELPELALSYDDVTGSTEATVEAMKKVAEAQAEQERFEESKQAYVELLKQQALLEDQILKAEQNVRLEQEQMDSMSDWDHTFTFGEWDDLETYKEKLGELRVAYGETNQALTEVELQYEKATLTIQEQAQAMVSYDDAVSTALESVKQELDSLVLAYDESYNAARSSLDSQIGLFENMTKAVSEYAKENEVSMGNMLKSLQSQAEYLAEYQENLEAAKNLGVTDALIEELSDGSVESAAYLEAIVNSGEEKIAELNTAFEGVQEGKDQFASTVAEMETDFSASMDAIGIKLEESIDGLNMEAEAAKAAKETMSAYVENIKSQTESARSAALAVATAVKSALSTSGSVKVPNTVPGFAKGTMDAPNMYVAGEEGPELIVGAAGSTVFPTEETEKILGSMESIPLHAEVPESITSAQKTSSTISEKKITLEIAGSGLINIGGVSKESVLNLMLDNVKPILMQILQQEILEEGDVAYEF